MAIDLWHYEIYTITGWRKTYLFSGQRFDNSLDFLVCLYAAFDVCKLNNVFYYFNIFDAKLRHNITTAFMGVA